MEELELNENKIREQRINFIEERIPIPKAGLAEKDEEKEMPPAPESTANPYEEEDPKVSGAEYKQSKFLSRGCSSCPQSYHVIDQMEIHRCAKLDNYNWMKNIKKPFNENNFDIVEVRFKNNRKEFCKLPDGLDVTEGDVVAVEGNPGHDVGIVGMTGELCRIQMKKRNIDAESVKKLYRRAKASDIEKWVQSFGQEDYVVKNTKKHIDSLGLSMKLNDVEIQGDGSKAVFYYTADERVDFRDLIKVLAEEFRVRVEMKQIGVRQESSRLGGIGTCGRELCCSTWLTNFQSVNTTVAKTQQIVLNPQKLAGQCGKLKCCLNYEYEIYLDAISKFPDSNIPLKTKKGIALFVKTDIFRNLMWYSYENENEMYALSINSVKDIIAMNKRSELPEKIEDYKTELISKIAQEPTENEFDLSFMADKIEREEQPKATENGQRMQPARQGARHSNERRPHPHTRSGKDQTPWNRVSQDVNKDRPQSSEQEGNGDGQSSQNEVRQPNEHNRKNNQNNQNVGNQEGKNQRVNPNRKTGGHKNNHSKNYRNKKHN